MIYKIATLVVSTVSLLLPLAESEALRGLLQKPSGGGTREPVVCPPTSSGGNPCSAFNSDCYEVQYGSDGKAHVSLKQCFTTSAVAQVHWSVVGADGKCGSCAGNHRYNVDAGSEFGKLTIDPNAGECSKQICVHVHDESFRTAPFGNPTAKPCIGNQKKRCKSCSYANVNINISGMCDDGNFCTTKDYCSRGKCIGRKRTCHTRGECKRPGTCDPLTGCSAPINKPDGSKCDNGNKCTKSICLAGRCIAGNPIKCPDAGPCKIPGRCNPKIGKCSPPTNKKPGTKCVVDGHSGKCDGQGKCNRDRPYKP